MSNQLTELAIDSTHAFWDEAKAMGGGWPAVLDPVLGLDSGHQSVFLTPAQLAEALDWARTLTAYDDEVFTQTPVAWHRDAGFWDLHFFDVVIFEDGDEWRLDWTPDVAGGRGGPFAQHHSGPTRFDDLEEAKAEVLRLHQGF